MTEHKLPYYTAPSGLRERVLASVRQAPRRSRFRTSNWLAGIAAAAVVVAIGGAVVTQQRAATETEITAVLDGHLRSLAPGRLADVASTDQHTVKPWFAGKLDFSPPVVDLATDGFPLTGGRLDVVNGRPVAALIYARRNHIINVFVRPLRSGERATTRDVQRNGFNIITWGSGEMVLSAVSDLNLSELTQLRDLLRAHR